MKRKIAAAAFLASCSVLAGEVYAGRIGTAEVKEDFSSVYLLAEKTTTTTVTATELNDGTVRIVEETITTITPEEGDYTYVEYENAYVPYYGGYCYIDGIWIWRGHGIAPFPPPKFHPRPHPYRPHHPHPGTVTVKKTPVKPPAKPAAANPVHVAKPAAKPTVNPVKPAVNPAAPRGGGHAPAGGHR